MPTLCDGDADAPALQARQRDLQALALRRRSGWRPARGSSRTGSARCRWRAGRSCLRCARRCSPASSVGTMKALMPFLPARLVGDRHHDRDVAVLAAGDELLDAVEHVVVAVAAPRWSSGRRPREPTCGSVRQNAPSISPRASGFSQRSFCASLPQAIRIEHTGQLLTLTIGAGGAVAGGDLFQDQRQRQVVEPGAAALGRAPPRRSSRARPGPAARPAESGGSCPTRRPAARCGPARRRARRPARRGGLRTAAWGLREGVDRCQVARPHSISLQRSMRYHHDASHHASGEPSWSRKRPLSAWCQAGDRSAHGGNGVADRQVGTGAAHVGADPAGMQGHARWPGRRARATRP